MKTLKSHMLEKGHLKPQETSTPTNQDDAIENYSRNALSLCYLAKDFVDARKRGDGERVCRLYKFLLLFFKIDGRTKYSYQSLHLLAQINFLLPPALAHELKWNRFVNTKGYHDSNVELDRELEHRNKYVKEELKSFQGKVTKKSIERCSKTYNVMEDILSNFDKSSFNTPPSGKHTIANWKSDVKELQNQFDEEDLFNTKNGRYHKALLGFPKSYVNKIDLSAFKNWLYTKLDKFNRMPLYKEHTLLNSSNI